MEFVNVRDLIEVIEGELIGNVEVGYTSPRLRSKKEQP
jgi:hypothetical protein